jgi:UrcA family protein
MKTLITSAKLPRLVTTTIFGALAFGCGALSIAADLSDVPQDVVKFGDLNLSNRQGAATLYNRIVAAAHEVCKSFDTDMRDLPWHAQLDACIHKATADAVTKVGRPELFAVYNASHRQPLANTLAAR